MCFGGGGGAPLPTPEVKEYDFGPLPSLRGQDEADVDRPPPVYGDVKKPRRTGSERRSLLRSTDSSQLMRFD
jgi:hypothetical protein